MHTEVHVEEGEGRMGCTFHLSGSGYVSQTRHSKKSKKQQTNKQKIIKNPHQIQHNVLLFRISGFILDHKDLSSCLSNTTYSTFLYLSFSGSFLLQ